MIGNAILATTVIFLALALFLMQECRFLIPYRHVLFIKYGASLAVFAGVLFLNLFAAIYLAGRKLFLKDTGRKLAHLEKQLRTGGSISGELSRPVRFACGHRACNCSVLFPVPPPRSIKRSGSVSSICAIRSVAGRARWLENFR